MLILKWIFRKQGGKVWIGFTCLKTGTGGGLCEHDNEPSCPINGAEFFDQLSYYQLLNKDPIPWS
jgi:hypothetical protein